MKIDLVITDLTRMYRGRVCIAGYDKSHICYRPVLPPPGIPESTLVQDGHPIIFPFSVVQFEFLQPDPKPPHSEDYLFDPTSPHFLYRFKNWEKVLRWSLYPSVEKIFDQPVHDDWGFYVMDCRGSRSLGTVIPSQVIKTIYEEGPEGAWDYRIRSRDILPTKFTV